MRSFVATPRTVTRRWHVIDAEGRVLGRVATRAARLLQGKHKATYTPFLDTGDHVVIVNAAKVKLTGRKEDQKVYRRHTGYPGGLREVSYEQMLDRKPAEILRKAVYGMMPKTRLARQQSQIDARPHDQHDALADPDPGRAGCADRRLAR